MLETGKLLDYLLSSSIDSRRSFSTTRFTGNNATSIEMKPAAGLSGRSVGTKLITSTKPLRGKSVKVLETHARQEQCQQPKARGKSKALEDKHTSNKLLEKNVKDSSEKICNSNGKKTACKRLPKRGASKSGTIKNNKKQN